MGPFHHTGNFRIRQCYQNGCLPWQLTENPEDVEVTECTHGKGFALYQPALGLLSDNGLRIL